MMSTVAVKEQRRRDLTAVAVALFFHVLIGGVYILSDLFLINDVVDYSGPVLVKLGRTDAPEEDTESLPAAPLETVETPETSEPESAETEEMQKSGTPEETVKPQESESEDAREVPVSEEETGDEGQEEISSESQSGETGEEVAEAPPAEVEETVTVSKGREEGNAFETTFEASEGMVGRSLGAPIYFYLPLPKFITQDIYDSLQDDPQLKTRTADKKRGILNLYYESGVDRYILNNEKQPPFDVRPELWSILAEGGYEILVYKNEDYSLKGREVVFTFIVEVGSDDTFISNVKFLRRTGYSEIDEAVIYGFQKAVFYNNSDIPVKGRFTYRFE